MNKILFIGDSFTWGQGLYFYKWKEEGRKFPDTLGGMYPSHEEFITEDDLVYKDKISFTGLVSSHYGLIPIKRKTNGGSNTDLVQDMIKLLDMHNNSIDKVVFQFTTISRYQFRDLNMDNIYSVDKTFEEVFAERVKNFFNYVDGILQYFSNLYNFEYCYTDWLGDFYSILPTKFVTYSIKEDEYLYFGQFLDKHKIDLVVDNKPIIDLHLNKEGQSILTNSILSYFGNK
jgi:hypothetical protein